MYRYPITFTVLGPIAGGLESRAKSKLLGVEFN